jgi:hypothetical protein
MSDLGSHFKSPIYSSLQFVMMIVVSLEIVSRNRSEGSLRPLPQQCSGKRPGLFVGLGKSRALSTVSRSSSWLQQHLSPNLVSSAHISQLGVPPQPRRHPLPQPQSSIGIVHQLPDNLSTLDVLRPLLQFLVGRLRILFSGLFDTLVLPLCFVLEILSFFRLLLNQPSFGPTSNATFSFDCLDLLARRIVSQTHTNEALCHHRLRRPVDARIELPTRRGDTRT